MEIQIENLRKGDEVVIPCNNQLKYLKLLKSPKLQSNGQRYGAIPCTTKREETQRSYTYNNHTYIIKKFKYKCSPPEEHNMTIRQNFSHKAIWLVKREEL